MLPAITSVWESILHIVSGQGETATSGDPLCGSLCWLMRKLRKNWENVTPAVLEGDS